MRANVPPFLSQEAGMRLAACRPRMAPFGANARVRMRNAQIATVASGWNWTATEMVSGLDGTRTSATTSAGKRASA